MIVPDTTGWTKSLLLDRIRDKFSPPLPGPLPPKGRRGNWKVKTAVGPRSAPSPPSGERAGGEVVGGG